MKPAVFLCCVLAIAGCATLKAPSSGYALFVGDCVNPVDGYAATRESLQAQGFEILKEDAARRLLRYRKADETGVAWVHPIDLTRDNTDSNTIIENFGAQPFAIETTHRAAADALKVAFAKRVCRTSRVAPVAFTE